MNQIDEQHARQILLDAAYMADGRHLEGHPMRGLYTGLKVRPSGPNETEIREAFIAWWRESYPTPPGPHAITTHVAFAHHLLSTR